MDIYLRETTNKESSFRFPSLPDKEIVVERKQKFIKYDIFQNGTLVFPSGPDIKSYSWEGYFFGEHSKKLNINQKWISPNSCIKKLESWRDKGTTLNMIVSGGGINVDVVIQKFNYRPFGGKGDYAYEICFYLYRTLTIQTVNELGISTEKKKTTERADPKKEIKTKKEIYKVKQGDNLWSIARKYYGGTGEDWIKIYNANKSVIENTAKKYGKQSSDMGHWIYPGTALTIPT